MFACCPFPVCACHRHVKTSMNVPTKTLPPALRSASILWGAIGVSVRKATSWKKMGKHAPRGREVRQVFLLRRSSAHLTVVWGWPHGVCAAWGGEMRFLQKETAGNHYTFKLLVHVRTVLSLKQTAAPVTLVSSDLLDPCEENITNGSGNNKAPLLLFILFFLPQI